MEFEELTFLFNCGWDNRGQCRLNFDEAALLYKTVKSLDAPRGVEIGRLWGGSTVLLAAAVGPDGFFSSIDVNPQCDEKIGRQLASLGMRDRVRVRTGDSRTINMPAYDLDFVFIDGDHSYEGVKADQERWGTAVRPGGYVIHHDMTPGDPDAPNQNGPQRVFYELMAGDEFELVARAGSVAVFQKGG